MRKQYWKRDPEHNPIGPEPVVESPSPSPEPPQEDETEQESKPAVDLVNGQTTRAQSSDVKEPAEHIQESEIKSSDRGTTASRAESELPSIQDKPRSSVEHDVIPQEESKDWLQLPMLTKLDSMHLLVEWQFQNTHRLRSIMKDDDETAQWVSDFRCSVSICTCLVNVFVVQNQRIEPIGYDAKTNAYWLIGRKLLSNMSLEQCLTGYFCS